MLRRLDIFNQISHEMVRRAHILIALLRAVGRYDLCGPMGVNIESIENRAAMGQGGGLRAHSMYYQTIYSTRCHYLA